MTTKLKPIIFLILITLGVFVDSFAQPYKIQDNVERIVFLGNSITYGGKYIEYIDAYMTIRYPEKAYEIINVGLPSETVSGLSEVNHANGRFPRPDLHERLKRVLTILKPDLVISCYGMNDGIYLPFDDDRFEKFKSGIKWLHDEVKKVNSDIIHVTPPVYDEQKGKAYANVLDLYSDWLISKRHTSNWNVIDIHWPMKKELEAQRVLDSSFVFAKDGIHPNNEGHFLMAKQILLYFGEKKLVAVNDIKDLLEAYEHGERTLKLVEKRQRIAKDAWLTFIGHERPNMNQGLSIDEAQQKLNEINAQIEAQIKN